jgi:thiol-disulfide isomerase/thioredoxin
LDRRVTFILALVIAITGVLLAVKGKSHPVRMTVAGNVPEAAGQDAGTLTRTEAPSPGPKDPAIGSLAPNFILQSVPKGKPVSLASLRGKPVVVNFWATWCGPCKIEMPSLVALQKKYEPQGVRIVGVAMDDATDKVIADFAQKMNVNYLVLRGTEKVGELYGGVDRMPTTFYLDKSGKVVEETVGMASEEELEAGIRKSLNAGK